ncbi:MULTISPECIES: biotin/lipoyl-containing protein [Mesonia]|uniref:Dihydrolipoyllysine-residue acetyltransferase component of pyruvate dehydrogenase complex n=1 Tax=Mesonia oceanica TaxID=2687242 RepID=A0AC61Y5V0_9FLAO|nr:MULTISPECIES: biotin/lipoyl-containing protein [Mesonia]MAN27996.1 hypothetical protein [Mesonia sp.]MAQ42474.1 hypothetical protein [Mesonia sp.]MBJ96778.1 hypothetical protein [Flavobacteriaceae bacterium]VVU99242.1 Dihydrolipoyllysine-residue acetyltransferase component of pyruvate dehydrogenase complex [Mesonia oceanica]|tara:strand:- start:13749 stop:14138 length:390 start_codon:yes stop_codon:yes gene_type:complete
MIKFFIRKLFPSNNKLDRILNDLKSNPNFKTKKEIKEQSTEFNPSNLKLEKGKVESIFSPDLGDQKGLVLTKWFVQPGDIVNYGDIICEIENKNIVMEFESFYNGKIISTCSLNQNLTTETELFKIEGI